MSSSSTHCADVRFDSHKLIITSILLSSGLIGACSSGGGDPAPRQGDSLEEISCSEVRSLDTGSDSTQDNESALACFNPELYQSGEILTRYKAVPDCRDIDKRTTVAENVTFRGQNATELRTSFMERTTGAEASGTLAEFVRLNEIQALVEELGRTSLREDGNSRVETRTHYEPARQFRFDMQAGDSFTQSFVATSESTVQILDPQNPSQQSSQNIESIEQNIRFAGFQTIDIDAGNFASCRFDITERVIRGDGMESNRSSTIWLHQDSGVLLKEQSGTRISDLSGEPEDNTLNGRSISPP